MARKAQKSCGQAKVEKNVPQRLQDDTLTSMCLIFVKYYTILSLTLSTTTLHHFHNRAVQNVLAVVVVVIVVVVHSKRQSLRYSLSQSKLHHFKALSSFQTTSRGIQQNYFFMSLLHSLDVNLPNNFATRVNLCYYAQFCSDGQINHKTT